MDALYKYACSMQKEAGVKTTIINAVNSGVNYAKNKVNGIVGSKEQQKIKDLYTHPDTIKAGLGIGGPGDKPIRKGVVPADMLKNKDAVRAFEERGYTLIGR